MKQEKQVKSYTRRTKSGKTITVKAHTAKYEAADKKDASKKKGAGKEIEDLKGKKGVNILDSDEWFEFENNFEEGWTDNPDVKCLANREHHRQVAAEAARTLSKKYNSQDDVLAKKNATNIMQKAYDAAAKKFYPKEKLWSGDNAGNPAFWYEHLKDSSARERKTLWHKEWGKYEDFGKGQKTSSGGKVTKKSTPTKVDAGKSVMNLPTKKIPTYPVKSKWGRMSARQIKDAKSIMEQNGVSQKEAIKSVMSHKPQER